MNILVIGKGKTGTTIISKTIQQSIPGAAYYLEPKVIGFFLNKNLLEHPNVVKIIYEHWGPRPNLREAIVHNELTIKFDKIVAIVRDIRDEAISRLFYIAHPLAQRGVETRAMEEWLSVIRAKERDPKRVSFLEMIARLNEIFGTKVAPLAPRDNEYVSFLKRNAARMCIVKYEDFINGQLSALESYLDFRLPATRDVGEFHWTKRSATYDNWKRFFTQTDVEELRPLYNPILSRWGYTDWELDDNVTLKSEECSGYVERIVAQANASTVSRVAAHLNLKKSKQRDFP